MIENLLRVDCVWDIETEDWDTFVCGGVWDRRTGDVALFEDEDGMAEALLAMPKGHTCWAHAGGRFDVLWLLDWCRRHDRVPEAVIRLSGSSIASCQIKGGPLLRDSFRLMPMALRECCTMFPGCAQKERLSLPCTCGEDCGGYCAISRNMNRAAKNRLLSYLEADILSLRDTLLKLVSYCDEHDVLLGGTVASTGWITARERCGLMNTNWELEAYRRARAGYYGGRCEVGITRAPLVHRFDRVQAYPAALCRPMPVGDPVLLDRRTAPKAWARGKAGVYFAAVEVPEMMAPPLPVRFRERIVYPWGLVIGSWPSEELAHAEEVGCKIVKLHGGIAWPRTEALLKPHVEHCFGLRQVAKAEGNKALSTWLKFVANSLTGAFAQDPESDLVALGEEYADDPAWEPVGRYDWIWRRGMFAIPSRGHVQWAATLTGNARVEFNRQQVHAGDDWAYGDTDSNYALRMLTRNRGTEFGEWDYEGPGEEWVCVAPKVYKYIDKKHDMVAKAKGIPMSKNPKAASRAEGVWPRIMAGQEITLDRGVDSLLVAAKGESLFHRRSGKRRVLCKDGWCGARPLDGTRTRPPHMSEVENIPR
jgi:hypothetical protein